jgi:DNA-binding GntR family transcriptional regulator
MTEEIDHEIKTPVWRQLADILREQILTGQILPEHVLPSEPQLEQRYGLSRTTIRKGIALLRTEGLVETIAGRGSYVVSEAELREHQRGETD